MKPIELVLMVIAMLCFFLAALNVQLPRGNFVAAGLFLLTVALALR